MKILAVDTALGGCSVALLEDGKILAHIFEAMDRGHAERLAPMVEETMRGFDFASLDRLAVTTGPGTFTGQRVGLAFMRGLRLALKRPLTGVTTLEVIAAAAMAETKQARAAVIHDARREEAYLLLQDGEDTVQQPVVMLFATAIERIRAFGPCALAGTGAAVAKESLGADFALSGIRQPDALWVARLAQKRAPSNDAPGPLYLRAPDAKLPGGRSIGQPSEAKASAVRPDGESLVCVVPFDSVSGAHVLAVLHAACFPQPWDAAALSALLVTPGTFAFAHDDGFVLARAAGGEAEILTLAVAPQARGKGLGRALLQAAIKKARSMGVQTMFLEVGIDNPAAMALYAGLGFTKVGMRKGYYSGTDALVLRLPLPANIE